MNTSKLALAFGSTVSVLILLSSGGALATEGFTFNSTLSLLLGLVMFGSTILFWGDAKRHEARMEGLKMMIESLEEMREMLNTDEKPPKAAGKKK